MSEEFASGAHGLPLDPSKSSSRFGLTTDRHLALQCKVNQRRKMVHEKKVGISNQHQKTRLSSP